MDTRIAWMNGCQVFRDCRRRVGGPARNEHPEPRAAGGAKLDDRRLALRGQRWVESDLKAVWMRPSLILGRTVADLRLIESTFC